MSSIGQNLTANAANYQTTLQTYLSYRHQHHAQAQWMQRKFGLRMKQLFATKEEIKVLAVGSGSGETDIEFLNEIVSWGRERHGDGYRVTYEVVEPNSSCADYFRNTVRKNKKYSNVMFRWFSGSFEDFCMMFGARQKYDIVHFARCFYHIDSEMGLNTAYNRLLADNGCIAVLGENSGYWPKLLPVLADNDVKHEAFSVSGSAFERYFLPGWISQALKNDWIYESYVQAYEFDVTPIYDPSSKDGNRLLDFSFHIRDARKHLRKELMDAYFRFLDKDVYVKETISGDGRGIIKCFPCEFGAIMITKVRTC